MHLWFYARNTPIRHQANLDRLNLVFRDPPRGCYTHVKEYLDGANPEALSKQLDDVIEACDIDEGSLIECLAFLMYLEEKHPTRVSLGLIGLAANSVSVLRRIVDSDIIGYDVQVASVYQVNKLLEYVYSLACCSCFMLFCRFPGNSWNVQTRGGDICKCFSRSRMWLHY